MIKTRITRYDEKPEILLNDYAQWSENRILCSDNTIIDYTEEEIVIKYMNPYPGHLIFIKQEKSLHTINTEFGILRLNVFTLDIIVNIEIVTIIYELEGKKNKLVIEGVGK